MIDGKQINKNKLDSYESSWQDEIFVFKYLNCPGDPLERNAAVVVSLIFILEKFGAKRSSFTI